MSKTLKPLSRAQLAAFLKDPYAVKYFEQLLSQAGVELPQEILDLLKLDEEAHIAADNAAVQAQQALALLSSIEQSLALLATSPVPNPVNQERFEVQYPGLTEQESFAPLPKEQLPEEFFFLPPVDGDTLAYGSMYSNTPTVVNVAVAGTAYEITSGISTGLVNLMTFGGSHYLQADRGGIYEINWSISVETSNAGDSLEGGVVVDGTALTYGLAHSSVSNANSEVEISGSVLVNLSPLQQLSLYVKNHSAARDITFDHITFVAKLIDRRVVT